MKLHVSYLLLLFATATGCLWAITPAELQALMASDEGVTLVDLRSRAAFEAGTLPDAMRMTAREAMQKPFKGRVVFFDDGLGVDHAGPAAALLAEKNSEAQADKLAGGFAAWRGVGGQTSEREGMTHLHQRYVTYQALAGPLTDQADEIVLLDVRAAGKTGKEPRKSGVDASSGEASPVDVAAAFPHYAVTRALPQSATVPATKGQPGRTSVAASDVQPLYVLIDAGDGTAEKVAQTLKAGGLTRVVILAGGENIIRRKGMPGLLRRGPGTGLAEDRDGSSDFATVVEEEAKP